MSRSALTLIGTTVAHSLWIGALIAACAATALRLLRHASPVVRYWIAMAALVAVVGVPVLVLLGDRQPRLVTVAGVAWVAGAGALGVRLVNSLRLVRRLRSPPRRRPAAGRRRSPTRRRRSASVGCRSRSRNCWKFRAASACGGRRSSCRRACFAPGADAFRAIAAHELAHVERRDYLWNLVQVGFEAALFFHPAPAGCRESFGASASCRATRPPARPANRWRWHAPACARSRARAVHRPGRRIAEQPLVDCVRLLVSPAESRMIAVRRHGVAGCRVGGALVFSILSATGIAAAVGGAVAAVADGGGPRPAGRPAPRVRARPPGGRRHAGHARTRCALGGRLGAAWGAGHTMALLALGSVLVVARLSLPAVVVSTLEGWSP